MKSNGVVMKGPVERCVFFWGGGDVVVVVYHFFLVRESTNESNI